MEFDELENGVGIAVGGAGAALRRLPAIGGPGQTDFAHLVSTNYSQYKMWCFERCNYQVNHEQDLGLASFGGSHPVDV
jgi:hypothetical protein